MSQPQTDRSLNHTQKALKMLGLRDLSQVESEAQDLPAEVDSYHAVPTRDIDCITF